VKVLSNSAPKATLVASSRTTAPLADVPDTAVEAAADETAELPLGAEPDPPDVDPLVPDPLVPDPLEQAARNVPSAVKPPTRKA
jgi:hypothetical protein